MDANDNLKLMIGDLFMGVASLRAENAQLLAKLQQKEPTNDPAVADHEREKVK
jgi:hypothetical protein